MQLGNQEKKNALSTKEDNCVKGIAYMPNQMKIEKKNVLNLTLKL